MSTKAINVRDLGRMKTILQVLARSGFGHLFTAIGIGENLPPADPQHETAPYARRLRNALVELGPTYVKLGQVLSMRPDMLPADLIKEFESLQDSVPPFNEEVVRQVISDESGQTIEDLFLEFDMVPLGSASIAQVHRAKLQDGTSVAIKLQRPKIRDIIRSDLHILYSFCKLIEHRFKLPGLYTPTAIVQEFDIAIMRELDFLQELNGARKMSRCFSNSDTVKVPIMYKSLSTTRMLVMELAAGKPLSSVMANPISKNHSRTVAHNLMNSTYEQVFTHGFFHGDPHPGNIFVSEDGDLTYLDFGVTGTLTGAMQDTIISEFTAIVFQDPEALAIAICDSGGAQGRVDIRSFKNEIEALMTKYHGASLNDLTNPSTLLEIVEVTTRYKIDMPPEYALMARMIALVEGTIRALMPNVDIVEEVKPYAQRLVTQRFAPDRLAADTAKLLFQLQAHAKGLPLSLNQVLSDLESGNLAIKMTDPEAHLLRKELQQSTLRISLALLASTTTLGAFIVLAAWSPAPFWVPVFGIVGIGVLLTGYTIFGALGLHVFFVKTTRKSIIKRAILRIIRFFSWSRKD